MGYLRRPLYYREFQCIASDCTDSCCQGWEIDIDEDTFQYYQSVSGSFGKRLKNNIALPDAKTDEPAHFIQAEHERCPFLNKCNLCDIILTLGEEHISHICTHHPRFYDWLIGGQEAGLGLCCEAAARLILKPTGYPEFEIISDGISDEEVYDEDLLFERQLEKTLFDMREELFHVIKNHSSITLTKKMSNLFDKAEKMQEIYDAILFPIEEDVDTNTSVGDTSFLWDAQFWTEANLMSLLDFYLTLEINDVEWFDMLHKMKGALPDILSKKQEFQVFYQEHFYEYEQLLIYFLYRYLLKAREDDCVFEKINFALIATNTIQLMDIYTWISTGTLSEKQQIDACKLYSKEIEYDEENMEKVSTFSIQ